MSTFREIDPLVVFLEAEESRVLELIVRASEPASRQRAAALDEARRILMGLAEAETEVLHAAFSRVKLRPETQALLDDSRGARAEQLAGLECLGKRRGQMLRKLAAVELSDMVRSHGERLGTLLVPVLSSQLPRPVHRALTQAFINRVRPVEAGTSSAAERSESSASASDRARRSA